MLFSGSLSVIFRDWHEFMKSRALLGNLAYGDKEYYKALAYWQACDSVVGWYRIGRFYGDTKEEDGCASSDMKDETKARKALERCIKLDWKFDEAKMDLGLIYLFGDKSENLNYTRAKELLRILSGDIQTKNGLTMIMVWLVLWFLMLNLIGNGRKEKMNACLTYLPESMYNTRHAKKN